MERRDFIKIIPFLGGVFCGYVVTQRKQHKDHPKDEIKTCAKLFNQEHLNRMRNDPLYFAEIMGFNKYIPPYQKELLKKL